MNSIRLGYGLIIASVVAVGLAGCGDIKGRIGLGKYGEITSGTYNIDMTPVLDAAYPPAKSYSGYNADSLPPLEK